MNIFADQANWLASALVATTLHGGLLAAYIDQMNGGVSSTTNTEITILDLPPAANSQSLKSLKVKAVSPEIEKLERPPVLEEQKRLASLSKTAPSAVKPSNFDKIKVLQPERSSPADTFPDKATIVPQSTFETLPQASETKPVENTQATEAEVVRDPITKVTDQNNATVIERKTDDAALMKSVTPETDTVTSLIEAQKAVPIDKLEIAKPALIPKVQKPTQPIAKEIIVTKPVNPDDVRIAKLPQTQETKPLARANTIDRTPAIATAIPKPSKPKPVLARPNLTRPTLTRPTVSKPQKSSLARPTKTQRQIAPVARTQPTKRKSSAPRLQKLAKAAPLTAERPKTSIAPSSSIKLRQSTNTRPLEAVTPAKKLNVVQPKTSPVPKKKKKVMRVVNIQPQRERPSGGRDKLAMRTRPDKVQGRPQEADLRVAAANYGRILSFLEFNRTDECFIALPTISKNGRIEVSAIGIHQNLWAEFQKNLVRDTNIKVPGNLATISQAQCQAVSFAKRSGSYPSFSLSMNFQNSDIRSGEFLIGNLKNVRGRYLNLLLVDDEGIAQKINNYVSIDKITSQFRLQVNQTGEVVKTSQLLLAVVTNEKLASTINSEPVMAIDLLGNIEREIISRNMKLDLAIAAFTVR